MGRLDQPTFETLTRRGCTACGGSTVEIHSFIDRSLVVMLAEPNDSGRWVHDGEKFVDGTYRIACASCATITWQSDDCPRCNASGGLARALADGSRLAVPKRCPKCNELELLALALIPATAHHGGGETPKPKPLVDFGDPGYHIVGFACDACDNATVTQCCPLCDAPGPLRPRP